MRIRPTIALALLLGAAACSDDPAPAGGADVATDLRQRDDVGDDRGAEDAPDDVVSDALGDASADADTAPDAPADAGDDSGADLTIADADPDATPDLATDSASDAGDDAAPDASSDSDASGDEPDLPSGPTPRPGDLVIVEIGGNPVGTGDDQGEYVEVLNVSDRDIALDEVTIAYHAWTASGSEPARSVSRIELSTSLVLAPGVRALLGPGPGQGFSTQVRYSSFEITNAETMAARVRLYTPAWDGTEPPAAAHLIDGVTIPAGTFGNDNRGRAWQLVPAGSAAPSAENNDAASNWCLTATSESLEYAANNYGTPGDPNDCN